MEILKKITFILPTCEPDEMFKWLLPSLKNIRMAKEYINFAICFQPPYTEEEINKVLNELNVLGFEYKYFYKDYEVVKPYTPLLRMRNDCAMLYPNSLVYGLLDDDMSFECDLCAGDLLYTLTQFIKDNNICVVAWKSLRWEVSFLSNCFATDGGIFYRGGVCYGFEGLMPENLYQFHNLKKLIPNYKNENLLELFGGYQDKFCADIRILNNIKDSINDDIVNSVLIVASCCVEHVKNRKERGAIAHNWKPAELLEGSIAQFIISYFNDSFLKTNSMSLLNTKQIECKEEYIPQLYNIYDKLQSNLTIVFNYPLIDRYSVLSRHKAGERFNTIFSNLFINNIYNNKMLEDLRKEFY